MNTQKDKRNALKQKENNLLFEFQKGLESPQNPISINSVIMSFVFFERVRLSFGLSHYQCQILFVMLSSRADNVPFVTAKAISVYLHPNRPNVIVHTYDSIRGLVSLGLAVRSGDGYGVSDGCYVRLIGLLT